MPPTPADRHEFAAMWAAGVPTDTIAAHFGISPSSVRRWRHRLGLPKRKGQPPAEPIKHLPPPVTPQERIPPAVRVAAIVAEVRATGAHIEDVPRREMAAMAVRDGHGPKKPPQVVSVTLGWPPRCLWPNGRAHWSEVADRRQVQRTEAFFAAKEAGLRKSHRATGVRLTFHPPDARRRDLDGMLGAMKSGLDGIADAMGQDDSEWAVEVQRGPVMRPGRVVVEVLT